MGGISPVIEAYLAAQQQQGGLLKQAQDIINQQQERKQRQQQIDELVSQHKTENDLAAKRLDMEQAVHNLQFKKTQFDVEQAVREGMRSGDYPIPGTLNLQKPGIDMAIPGSPNIQTGTPTPIQILPPVGTPVNVETPFGTVNTPRPQTHGEAALAQQSELLPGLVKQYKATIGDTKTQELQNKLDLANSHNELQQDYFRNLINSKDAATAMRETVARIEGENSMRKSMFLMGINDPETSRKIAINNVTLARMGMLNPETEKLMNPIEKNLFKQLLDSSQSVVFDNKKKDNAMQNLSSGASLLNDFASLDSKYPASKSILGRTGNSLAVSANNVLPWGTDIGQEFKRFEANIANLAKQTGETPSMARSVALAKKAEAAAPKPNDSPDIRTEKFNKLGDLALDVIQTNFQNLPIGQRIDNWNQVMDSPLLQTLKKNVAFKNVFENIKKTGNYDPSLIGYAQK